MFKLSVSKQWNLRSRLQSERLLLWLCSWIQRKIMSHGRYVNCASSKYEYLILKIVKKIYEVSRGISLIEAELHVIYGAEWFVWKLELNCTWFSSISNIEWKFSLASAFVKRKLTEKLRNFVTWRLFLADINEIELKFELCRLKIKKIKFAF